MHHVYFFYLTFDGCTFKLNANRHKISQTIPFGFIAASKKSPLFTHSNVVLYNHACLLKDLNAL